MGRLAETEADTEKHHDYKKRLYYIHLDLLWI